MTAVEWYRLVSAWLSLAAAGTATVLGILGWATNRPDGVARFTRRFWAWVSVEAGVILGFGAESEHRWWNWLWVTVAGAYALSRCSHWWKQLELARRFEREMARFYGVTR